jgi:hypothetical protein
MYFEKEDAFIETALGMTILFHVNDVYCCKLSFHCLYFLHLELNVQNDTIG